MQNLVSFALARGGMLRVMPTTTAIAARSTLLQHAPTPSPAAAVTAWRLEKPSQLLPHAADQRRSYLKHTWRKLTHSKGNSEFPSVTVRGNNQVGRSIMRLQRMLTDANIRGQYLAQKVFVPPTVRRRRRKQEFVVKLFQKKLAIKYVQTVARSAKLERETTNYDGV